MLQLPAAPMDRRLLDVVRQPALQDLLAQARRENESPSPVPVAELTMPGGQRLQWTAWPLDRAGIGMLLGVRDVTALRRLETMRRDFISNVSHELRTPVATVYAAAEALAARYGVDAGTASKISELAKALIITAKAFAMGLTSSVIVP